MAIAEQYANNPRKLANKVYSGRMGNGDEASGDGYLFRGRGIFQLTGRENYTRFFQYIKKPMNPDYLLTYEGAALSAAWYFYDRDLDRLAATPGVEDETRAINGGLHGLPERKLHFDKVVGELIRRGA
jgi:putative chitinase